MIIYVQVYPIWKTKNQQPYNIINDTHMIMYDTVWEKIFLSG